MSTTHTKQSLNARSAEIAMEYSPKVAGKKIHDHLMDLLAFNLEEKRSGDVSTLTKFVTLMDHAGKATVRIDAIVAWILMYCPCDYDKASGTFKGKPKTAGEMRADDNGQAHLRQANSEPWFALKPSDPAPKGFDLKALLVGIVKRADAALDGEGFDPEKVKITPDMLAALKALVA